MECGVQVRSVLQLYVDIEHTSRNNAFYEKYNLRYSMGELLRKSPYPCSMTCSAQLFCWVETIGKGDHPFCQSPFNSCWHAAKF